MTVPVALVRHRRRIAGVGGLAAVIAVWALLASTVFAGRYVLPTPTSVVSRLVADHFYATDLGVTLWEALRGFVAGNLAALLLAAVVALVRSLERPLLGLGVLTYCVPTIAVGPLLAVVVSLDTTKVAMAALAVFFITFESAVVGLRSTEQALLDLVHVAGGGRMTALWRVRSRAALPSLAGGLALSAPAAILGAMLGEYLGGQAGLGVLMVNAQQSLQVARTWAVALVATAVSGAAFALLRLVGRLAGGRLGTGDADRAQVETGAGPMAAVVALGRAVLLLGGILALWAVAVDASGLGSYVAKTPAAVWSYLTSGPQAAANRATVLGALATTVHDAGVGWLGGSAAAVVLAVVVVRYEWVAATVLPAVLVLRSVPLVAMTPLVALIFGRGLLGVAVIAGAVSFVPSFVLLVEGLRSVPPLALLLVRAHGGGPWRAMWSLRFRYGLPALFAAARISIPGSLLGAVLAEWLVTSSGVGHLMAQSIIFSDFSALWASVAVVSGLSVVCYLLVGSLGTLVRRHAS